VRLNGPSTVNLYDITGKQVYTNNHTNSTYIPTAEYAPGMYVLEILQPGFKGYREKIIKQ
jgi:hypothetical protein